MKILAIVTIGGMTAAAVFAFVIAEKLATADMTFDAWILRAAGAALVLSIPAPIYLAAQARKERD